MGSVCVNFKKNLFNVPQLVDGNTRPQLPPGEQKGQHHGRRAGTCSETKKTTFRIINKSTIYLGIISVNIQACSPSDSTGNCANVLATFFWVI